MKIKYSTAQKEDLKLILELQAQNRKDVLKQNEILSDGFVTLQHSLELLEKMNIPYPHILAKSNKQLAGYALVLLQELRFELPGLKHMFAQLKDIEFNNQHISNYAYFIMGQVCVHKDFRKKGIFRGLYSKMADCMKNDFDLIITEIDDMNQRSLNAHIGIGFELLKVYLWPNGQKWHIVALKIR